MAHESLIEWNGFQSFKSRDFFCDSRERKQSNGKETSSDDAEPEELAEEYSSLTDLTDEQMLEKASVAVQFEIGVKHTVMYDVYNLCEMAFENKLSFLKVKMLKEMCKHFEIPSNIKRHQINLIKKLSQMVEDCSFMKE